MLTTTYRGYFIHETLGLRAVRVQTPGGDPLGTFPSYRDAQRAITKHIVALSS